MAKIFSGGEEQLPVDQIIEGAVGRIKNRGGDGAEQSGIEQRLDEIIVLLGKLTSYPGGTMIVPRVYKIKLSQANTDASLGISKPANSITFLKPDASFTVKLQILVDGVDTLMSESKTIPAGKDTKIDGVIISDIIYTNSIAAGAADVEVTCAWI